ncbi:hypothetical protein ABMA28_005810 [Loxostege sticticalis]|uniref:NADH dehydrogenase [ubiquinone] 1 alpha subcomplex subunit 7 n=1 Tax=Loxostege sticticalis TaxID=481309 RepID=A0ABD0SMZ6_LOXSC
MSRSKWDYRDVSVLLQAIRNFLLGRKHTLHPRFPCKVSARSIPCPDIPRSPEDKYSAMYYHQRNPFQSVKPPVVAPVALGNKKEKIKPESVKLPGLPTPGAPWWWDGHSYFECTSPAPEPPPPPCPPMTQAAPREPTPCDPPPAPTCPPSVPPCQPCPPCPPSPDKRC